MAEPMTDLWEPWAPEVERWVRVRINGECPLHAQNVTRVLDGQIGVIFDDLREPRTGWHLADPEGAKRWMNQRHWWAVDFRRGSGGAITCEGKLVNGDTYCAAELEPVDG